MAQHGDAIREAQGFCRVMGDEQGGDAALVRQRQKVILQVAADSRIQRTERLVHQQDVWLCHQGPGQADPLLHAPGKLVGIVLPPPLQPHRL